MRAGDTYEYACTSADSLTRTSKTHAEKTNSACVRIAPSALRTLRAMAWEILAGKKTFSQAIYAWLARGGDVTRERYCTHNIHTQRTAELHAFGGSAHMGIKSTVYEIQYSCNIYSLLRYITVTTQAQYTVYKIHYNVSTSYVWYRAQD